MVACLTLAEAWLVFVLLIEETSARPQQYKYGNITSVIEFSGNKTRTRILSSPPKKNFFEEEQEIIFPDDTSETLNPISRIDSFAKCSEQLPLCENVDSYPYNHLRQVLEGNQLYRNLFGTDEAPELINRIGEDDEKYVCRSIAQTIFPKMGQTKTNKWKFIINQGDEDGFVQGVRIEICKNVDEECDIPGVLPEGYQTYCRQKYVYRRLLSISNQGALVPDNFKIPSACCCAYKQNLDFLSRFGKGFSPVSKSRKKK